MQNSDMREFESLKNSNRNRNELGYRINDYFSRGSKNELFKDARNTAFEHAKVY